MVAAKPDCTGQEFGLLTVLGKGDRVPYKNTWLQLWDVKCGGCGTTTSMVRNRFDRKQGASKSCGCVKNNHLLEFSRQRAKPDCTGQRFGLLTVLGQGELVKRKTKGTIRLWDLQCDCENLVSLPRSYFDRDSGAQKSCGCLGKQNRKTLVDNKQKPRDIAGQRFGLLVALHLAGKRDSRGQPLWLLQCDCGQTTAMSHQRLGRGYRLNCQDKSKHGWGNWYPSTPNPYPPEAGALVVKYLHLTRVRYAQVNAAVEDWKRDRLLRCAWIITHRRQQGEIISELHESRYISKSLRYASVSVHRYRTLERDGGLSFTSDNKAIKIGGAMTDLTPQNEAVKETQPESFMSTVSPTRRLKYRRC